ncbi:ABC transporter permease [Cryptosporangium sp. NPDC051539]|uniref:ABC transporter permease n=1 Tax=Cryptosporangium sp. NPDC051539 TaxID=3363962 RepID=UPI0037B90D32
MSTATDIAPPADAPARPARPATRVTIARVARSEWAKLWSIRSTWITLAVGALFLVALGTIAALRFKSNLDSGKPLDPDFADATTYSLATFGVTFAMIAFGVLGVLITAGEYSTGMIRSTMAAVPRRLPVLWSKAVVYGAVAFVVGVVGTFVVFLVSSGILSGTRVAMGLGDNEVVRGLVGVGVYLALVGVIGVALGTLLRSIAGGISLLVGVFLLLPGLMSLLPLSWRTDLNPYLPSEAGSSIFALQHASGALSAGTGLLVLCGWTALAVAAAAYRLVRSDV